MVFSGMVFLFAFVPAVFLLYFLLPRVCGNAVLFIASLFFYAWGEPKYIVLMIASTAAAYVAGLFADKEKYGKKAWYAALFAVVWNIGLLLYFKYSDFAVMNINSLFHSSIKLPGLSLPIGISFYSFQSLSYVIDVYRGEVKPQKNLLTLGTYVALFPQLVAGPIVRYIDIEKQLSKPRPRDIQQFASGAKRFSVGLAKKALLANNIYALFNEIGAAQQKDMSVAAAWLGVISYTFQIYFDFSGYSDMAIGMGKMLGFDFLENFDYPYISKSITEFWRRWHISLSSWFRDYVYIPLGGNRKGTARQCLNIAIVWALTGFWHGANWNFLLWGVYFGAVLLIEKFVLKKALDKLPAALQHVYALFLIVIGWGIFAYDDPLLLKANFANMFGLGHLPLWSAQTGLWLRQYAVLFIVLIIGSTPLMSKLGRGFNKFSPVLYQNIAEPFSMLFMLFMSSAYLASSAFNPFLYFRF